MRLDAIHDLLLRQGAHQLVNGLAALVDDHGRDVEYAELASVLLVLVNIDLGDLQGAGLLGSDLLKNGAYHAARATPWCPEIDQDGGIGIKDLILVGGIGDFNGFGHVYFLHQYCHQYCYYLNDSIVGKRGIPFTVGCGGIAWPFGNLNVAGSNGVTKRQHRSILRFDMKHRNVHGAHAPLSIAIDGNFLAMPHSGIGTYLRGLVGGLEAEADALGVEVRLITPQPGRFLHPGSRSHRFLWDVAGVTGGFLRTGEPRPSMLHLPQMSAPFWVPVPMVVTIHDVIPFVLEDYRASRAMRTYLGVMRRGVQRARRVIAPSASASADITRVLGIPEDRLRVIPEAASPDLVPATDGEATMRVRERWGIEGRYLFNIGGFDRRKNLPLLVEAFAAALPSLPDDVLLVIAGASHTDNPHLFPALEPVIRRYGLEDRVILTGRVSDEERRWLYQAAYACVTPSIYEGFGLTPLEAMACGVPAIVANRTSLPEVVGDAGLIVEPDVKDVAEAIRVMMTDDALRARLAAASLERASSFSWAAAARATAQVYHEVAGRPHQESV